MFALGTRGRLAVTTTLAFKVCAQHFRTILVDEFKTVMVNTNDCTVAEQAWSKRNASAVRGLMWFESTINNGFVNCDLIAALNTKWCLALPLRVAHFCRMAGQAHPLLRRFKIGLPWALLKTPWIAICVWLCVCLE